MVLRNAEDAGQRLRTARTASAEPRAQRLASCYAQIWARASALPAESPEASRRSPESAASSDAADLNRHRVLARRSRQLRGRRRPRLHAATALGGPRAKLARADPIESRVEFEAGPAANNPGLRAVLRRHAPSATRQRTLEANGIDCGAGPVYERSSYAASRTGRARLSWQESLARIVRSACGRRAPVHVPGAPFAPDRGRAVGRTMVWQSASSS
jgi:hypothetical protein